MDGTAASTDVDDHDAHDLSHVQPITARNLDQSAATLGRGPIFPVEDAEVDALVAKEKARLVADAEAYRQAFAEMIAARGRGEPYQLDVFSQPIWPNQCGEDLLPIQWERRLARLEHEAEIVRASLDPRD